jgi:hypothetical protein
MGNGYVGLAGLLAFLVEILIKVTGQFYFNRNFIVDIDTIGGLKIEHYKGKIK